MRWRHSLPAALTLLALPSFASGQTTLWISESRNIREITTATGASRDVHVSTGTAVGHMVYGPDARLYFAEYFADSSCISRLDPAGNVVRRTGANATYAPVFCSAGLLNEPRELRFDSAGDLLFATASLGVLRIPACALAVPGSCPAAPQTVVTPQGAGSGLDHAPDGAVLFTDGHAIARTPPASGFPIAVVNPVALDVVTGGLGSAFPSLPTGAVCASAGNAVSCFDKTGASLGALNTFPAIDIAQGFAFSKSDTAWVATSVDAQATLTPGQAPHNGLLWRIDDSGATVVYPTRFNGPQPPIVGVALPPTSKTITESTAVTLHDFVVGPDVFSITTQLTCRLALTVFERLPSEVQPCLDSTGLSLAATTYLGESFPTEYGIATIAGPCFADDPTAIEIITGFFPVGQNLAGVRRPDGAPKGNNRCESNTLANYALAAPNDAGMKMGSDGTSGFMGARVVLPVPAPVVQIMPPLQGAPIVTTDPTQAQIDAAAEQTLGNVAVKFSLTLGGELVTTPDAVFSVQRLGSLDAFGHLLPDSRFCDVRPQDAVTGPPRFFITSEDTHRFNLDTSTMTPLACTQPGLYAFGISFPVDGIAAPVTFLVELK